MNLEKISDHFSRYIHFYLVLTMLIWGVSWASSKVCALYTDTYTLLFLKFFLSVVAMAFVAIGTLQKSMLSWRMFWVTFLGVFFLLFYNVFFFMGLQKGFASFGGVFVTTINPIITFFLVALIYKSKIQFIQKIGLVIGLIGGLVMLRVWDASSENLFDSGNFYFFLAALGWSFVSIVSGYGSKYFNTFGVTFIFLSVASLVSYFFVPDAKILQTLSFDLFFWIHAFVAFVLTTAFATTIYFKAVAILGASVASSYLFLVPVFAAVSSNLILDEQIAMTTVIGGCFSILALYLINQKTKN